MAALLSTLACNPWLRPFRLRKACRWLPSERGQRFGLQGGDAGGVDLLAVCAPAGRLSYISAQPASFGCLLGVLMGWGRS